MEAVKKLLSSSVKIGKTRIPAVALFLVAALLVGGVTFWRTRNQPKTEEAVGGDPATNVDRLDPDVDQSPNLVASGSTGGTFEEPSNDLWVRQGVEFLTASGVNSTTAFAALSGYVNGARLSAEQNTLAESIVRRFGTPPSLDAPAQLPASPVTLTNGVYYDASSGARWQVRDGRRSWIPLSQWNEYVSRSGGKLSSTKVATAKHPLFRLTIDGPAPSSAGIYSRYE